MRCFPLEYAQRDASDHGRAIAIAAKKAQPVEGRDERQIAADFVAGRSTGLEHAYRAYGRVLYATARAVLGNDDDAQDCVHDTLVRMWQRGATYRPERGSFRAYLIVSVRNDAIARKRDATRHARIEERAARADDAAYAFDPPDPVERSRLREAIAALPADQREAVALAFFGHLTHTEVAARLGLPLGTVKGRLRLAMAKLSRDLGGVSERDDDARL